MIWFIDDYAGSPFYGMDYRNYHMAKGLNKEGVESLIVSASYSHFFNKFPPINGKSHLFQKVNRVNFLWLKVMKYRNSNSKRRVLKWFQFSLKLLKLPSFSKTRPDIIICSTTAPFSIFACYYLSKRYHAKLFFQIKDIWPLTLIELGNYSKYNPFIYLMQKSVNFAFKNSDMVISLLPYANKYIEEQGIYNYKFEYIPNGICLEELKSYVPLNFQTKSQIPSNKFIVGYAGSIGFGDELNLLIKTAFKLNSYPNIHFVIVGKGIYKIYLQQLIENLNLENVTLLDSIPKSEIPSLLKYFDVCYIGWKNKEIYKYGIAANKIFDYMYAKKPILHLYGGDGNFISDAKCGITVPFPNIRLLLEAILELYNLSDKQREEMGERGYAFVLKNHTYKAITKKFINLLQIYKKEI